MKPAIEKLLKFADLLDGWFDGNGTPFAASELDFARTILVSLTDEFDLPNPALYPTPEREIIAEWQHGEWAASLTFRFADKSLHLHICHQAEQTATELTEPFSARNLARRIGVVLHPFFSTMQILPGNPPCVGLFWFSGSLITENGASEPVETLVRVLSIGDDRELWQDCNGVKAPLSHWDGRWAGPIPRPGWSKPAA